MEAQLLNLALLARRMDQSSGGGMGFFLVLVIIGIVYLIVIRPQQRRQKEQQNQLKNIRRGDTVVTASGFIGKVTKIIDDNEFEIEIATNVRSRMLRSAITEVRTKGEPVKEPPAPKS